MNAETIRESVEQFVGIGRYERLERVWYRVRGNELTFIGLFMVGVVVFMAVFADFIAPYPEAVDSTNPTMQSQPPSLDHLMGTDTLGRDIFSRVIYGSRISLLVGALVITVGSSIGVTIGLIGGYLSGWKQTIIMRVVDMFLAIPSAILAMVVVAVLGPGLKNMVFALCLAWWTWFARLTYGEVLSVKEDQYVEADRALGANWTSTAFREVLPNITGPILVKVTLDLGIVILVAAGLSFLGLGPTQPTPDWGLMISSGREYVTSYWWISVFPGIAISWLVLGFNFVGDGLRDALDVEVD